MSVKLCVVGYVVGDGGRCSPMAVYGVGDVVGDMIGDAAGDTACVISDVVGMKTLLTIHAVERMISDTVRRPVGDVGIQWTTNKQIKRRETWQLEKK